MRLPLQVCPERLCNNLFPSMVSQCYTIVTKRSLLLQNAGALLKCMISEFDTAPTSYHLAR